MRLLVIGGSGFIGSSLVAKASERGDEVAYTYAHTPKSLAARSYHIDFNKDNGALETALAQNKPDAVVYCAVPNLDANESLHRQVSVEGVARTLALLEPATRFIYLSTNAVFSGLNGPYKEDAIPDAEACETDYKIYGMTKAAGESLTLKRPNSLIVRTATVDGKNAAGELSDRLEFLVSSLQKGARLKRFGDRYISPTLVDNLVDAVLEPLEPGFNYQGVLHIAGAERVTDFEYARVLARRLNVDETLVGESSFKAAFGSSGCLQDTSLDVRFTQGLLETKLLTIREQFRTIFQR